MWRMRTQVTALLLAAIVASTSATRAGAASREDLSRDADRALKSVQS